MITMFDRVNNLPQEMQTSIVTDIRTELNEYMDEVTIEYMVKDALCSRLCDLEDTIDIKKYITNK